MSKIEPGWGCGWISLNNHTANEHSLTKVSNELPLETNIYTLCVWLRVVQEREKRKAERERRKKKREENNEYQEM